MLAYLLPSPRGLSLIPGSGVLERIIMDETSDLKKNQFERKLGKSKIFLGRRKNPSEANVFLPCRRKSFYDIDERE